MKTASVFGKEILIPVLKRITQSRNLDYFLKKGLDESIWEVLSELVYIFKHALIREAVYEMQLKKTLRKLHLIAAETIEDVYRKKIESKYAELVYHYENAGNQEKTVFYLKRLAEQEKLNFQNIKAIEDYTKLLDYKLTPIIRCEILINLGLIYTMTGEIGKAEKNLKKAIVLSRGNKYQLLHSRALNKYTELLIVQGKYVKVFRFAEQSLISSKNSGSFQEQGDALLYLANASRRLGDLNRFKQYTNQLLELSKKTKYQLGLANAFGNLAIYFKYMNENKKSLKFMKEAVKIYRQIKNHRNLIVALGNLGIIYKSLEKFKEALRCFQENIKLCTKIGDLINSYFSYSNMGDYFADKSSYEKAFNYYSSARQIAERTGNKRLIAEVLNNLSCIKNSMMEYREAIDMALVNIKLNKEIKNESALCFSFGNICENYFFAGDRKMSKYYLDLHKTYCHKLPELGDICRNYFLYSLHEVEKGNINKAIEYINSAINECIMIKYYNPLSRYYYSLAFLQLQKGLFKEANKSIIELNRYKKYSSNKEIYSLTKILKNIIFYSQGNKQTINELKNNFKSFESMKEKAFILYWIWWIRGDSRYLKYPVKSYSLYFNEFPDPGFQKQIKLFEKEC